MLHKADLELSEAHALWLEDERKIPSELAVALGIRSSGKDLVFEYTQNGKLLWRQHRIEKRDGGKSFACLAPDGRPISEAGIGLSFWNLDDLNDVSSPNVPRIITEGQFDCASFKAAGFPFVVSVPNGASGQPGQGEIVIEDDRAFGYLWVRRGEQWRRVGSLETAQKIILATDDDKPGRILRDELATRLGRSRCWWVTYPDGCKDANDVLQAYGADEGCRLLREMVDNAQPLVPTKLAKFSDIPVPEQSIVYAPQWGTLEPHLRIVQPQLIVVTGVPNAGKSLWTLNLGAGLARVHGLKGALLRFEDDVDATRQDLLRYARAWHGQPKNGIRIEPEAWIDEMFRTISPSEEIDDDADFNLTWLHERIAEAASRHGCKWVLIDPWNEVEHMWGRQETEATYLNRAIKDLKRQARRYQITIIVVAHPRNDAAEANALQSLTLASIAGGAAWNNKADVGVVVWAEDPKKPERTIKVCKSRNFRRMGTPGEVELRLAIAKGTYEQIAATPAASGASR